MPRLSKKELEKLKEGGAELEYEPRRIQIEGLLEAMGNLKQDNSEVLTTLRDLISKIDQSPSVEVAPSFDAVNHNKVVVDTTPILDAVERLTARPNYRFTVNRNPRGQIESMDAEVI